MTFCRVSCFVHQMRTVIPVGEVYFFGQQTLHQMMTLFSFGAFKNVFDFFLNIGIIASSIIRLAFHHP